MYLSQMAEEDCEQILCMFPSKYEQSGTTFYMHRVDTGQRIMSMFRPVCLLALNSSFCNMKRLKLYFTSPWMGL